MGCIFMTRCATRYWVEELYLPIRIQFVVTTNNSWTKTIIRVWNWLASLNMSTVSIYICKCTLMECVSCVVDALIQVVIWGQSNRIVIIIGRHATFLFSPSASCRYFISSFYVAWQTCTTRFSSIWHVFQEFEDGYLFIICNTHCIILATNSSMLKRVHLFEGLNYHSTTFKNWFSDIWYQIWQLVVMMQCLKWRIEV